MPQAARTRLRRLTTRALAVACALAAASFSGAVVQAQPAAAGVHARSANTATRLHARFDDYWSWIKRENPEFATFLGDDRYDERLTDLSPAAIDRRKAYLREVLARLRQFDARALAEQDALSLAVLQSQSSGGFALPRFRSSACRSRPSTGRSSTSRCSSSRRRFATSPTTSTISRGCARCQRS
jgi:uncharacterized protein (DUF885 family)